MNTAIAKTEGAKTRVLPVEWGHITPKAVEIRYNDDGDGEMTFVETGYPWESCILREDDLVEVA
jgi:hypothetical protein